MIIGIDFTFLLRLFDITTGYQNMQKMQSSRRRSVSIKTLFFFAGSAILFVCMLWAVCTLGSKYLDTRSKLSEDTSEQQTLERKKQELTDENAYLNTPEGQEHMIRDKYSLVKPGEGLIVITEPSSDTVQAQHSGTGIARWWDTLLKGLGIRH